MEEYKKSYKGFVAMLLVFVVNCSPKLIELLIVGNNCIIMSVRCFYEK